MIKAAASKQGGIFQLKVRSPDDPNRSRHGAHHNGFCLDKLLTKLDTRHQCTIGDASRSKQAVAPHHVFDQEYLLRIDNTHSGGAFALFIAVEHQSALHLAADTA